MTGYERIWRLFAGAVAALGIVLELLTHSPTALLFFIGLSLGVSVCIGLGLRGEPDVSVPVQTTVTQIVRATLLGVISLTALVGLATLGALTMLFVAAVVVTTSPPFVRKIVGVDVADRRPAHAVDAAPGSRIPFAPPIDVEQYFQVDVDELASSDLKTKGIRELVRDWRRSFLALEQAGDAQTKIALVKVRQAFLDELERRDPDGLQEWLESGARAAGDPSKFMSSGSDAEPGDPHAA